MDDLLLAVGETKLRWRGATPSSVAPAAPPTSEDKLMELAFRLGQASCASSGSPRNAEPIFPALKGPGSTGSPVEENVRLVGWVVVR